MPFQSIFNLLITNRRHKKKNRNRTETLNIFRVDVCMSVEIDNTVRFCGLIFLRESRANAVPRSLFIAIFLQHI